MSTAAFDHAHWDGRRMPDARRYSAKMTQGTEPAGSVPCVVVVAVYLV